MDAHDAIEVVLIGIIPDDGIEDVDGVTHTACSLSLAIVKALEDAGHKIVEDYS